MIPNLFPNKKEHLRGYTFRKCFKKLELDMIFDQFSAENDKFFDIDLIS